jgi:hypothetical protein
MPRTSRLAIISMLAVLAALLPGASSASAVGINGISDENVGEWKPYSWAALENTGVKLVRKIVPWDVALNAGSLAALHSWVSTVESGTGIQVLISFNHVANTTPPPIASYSQAITQFRQEFPQIGAYTAWNEPNHFPSDPATHNSNPSKLEQAPLAAEYWIALHNQCQAAPACTVAAGDFNEAGSPTNFTDYVNAYKSRIAQSGLTPPVWAYHPYSAINDGSFNFVLNTFLPLIPADKPIWFTEAGGYVCVPGAGYVGGSYATALSHQEQAAQNYVNLVNQVGGRVHRAYYYFFSPKEAGQIACPGGSASKMDTGLLDGNGFARPAFKKVFAHAVLPPLATTNGATGVGSREGTMNGSIDPRGYHTYYYFEYGATTAYGGVVPDPNTDRYHGFNSGWGSRSATLTGLKPATTYHYRVVAESNMGTTYGADQTFKTLAEPESDVNGDHKADLVTLHTSGNIYNYMGDANGFFGNYTSSGGGGMNPAQYDGTGYYPIDVAEVNGDDYDDLVAIDQYGSVATAKGQANGYFAAWSFSLNSTITPAINNPTPGKYEPVGVADVTGDGRGDLVAYNNVEKAIYTYPGTSTGSFSTTKVASVSGADSARFDSSGEYFLDVADVTGDGKADLVSQTTNGYAKVYPATGTGGFGAAVLSFSGTLTSALATGSGWDPIALADVNGDGFADLVTHHSSGNVYTYMGKADGTFGAYTTAFGGTADSNLFDGTGQEFAAVIDVNGDGFADLITAGYGNVYTYLGDAGGYFGGPNSSFGGTYVSTRFNKGAGYQMVMEKTLKKRDGCTPTGCK